MSRPTEEVGDYLQAVGQRLRRVRAQRGMTRRALSAQSGVSERFIAQLEAGTGNVSILLLRQLARALGTDPGLLAAERADRPVELVLFEQMLARLPPDNLTEARRLMLERFGPPSPDRRARVALVGLRGGGKSTIGRALAERRGVRFVDLDREIEREGRMDLREMFELRGQPGFRALEYQVLERLIAEGDPMVIATGGGLVAEPATYALLLAQCLTVWIKAAPEEHMARVVRQGDLRPMRDNSRAMDDLHAILESRTPLYARADLTLDTTGRTVEACVEELAERVG